MNNEHQHYTYLNIEHEYGVVVLINAEEMSQFPHQKCSIAPSIENNHVFHLVFIFASDQYVCQLNFIIPLQLVFSIDDSE